MAGTAFRRLAYTGTHRIDGRPGRSVAILKHLEDKYEILETVQESGAGAIYKVRHRLLNELRAVKVLHVQSAGDSGQREQFLSEARAAIQLGHPSIAQIFDCAIDDDGVAIIVMELITGMSLAELQAQMEPPPLALTLEIARQSLRAIGYLHQHAVVQRDVSPSNLMLTRDVDGRPLVKMIDLGIGRDLEDGSASSGLVGKFRYAAPESFEDQVSGDPRLSDLYSFALVLYELLTGRFPIAGESASSVIAGHLFRPPLDFAKSDPEGRVPEPVRRAVLKALAKSPGERFADAESFAAELMLASPVEPGRGADLASLEVQRILELTQVEKRPSDTATAPTRILRPRPEDSTPAPIASPQTGASTTLESAPSPAAETRRLSLDQVRTMQAAELTSRARGRAEAEDFTQALELLRKALEIDPDHQQAKVLQARVQACLEVPGQESPRVDKAPVEPVEVEPVTERLDDSKALRELRQSAAMARGAADSEDSENSTTVIRSAAPEPFQDRVPPPPHQGRVAPASQEGAVGPLGGDLTVSMVAVSDVATASGPGALDESLHSIRALRDDGRAGEALKRLNLALREFGPQPTLRTLRDELAEALLEQDAEQEESASQMFQVEPAAGIATTVLPAAPPAEVPPDGLAPNSVPPNGAPSDVLAPDLQPDLAEAMIRGLSDASIRSFEPVAQQVRDRPGPPTAHPTRNMVVVGLVLVVVFAALVFVLTRKDSGREGQQLEAEDVAAAALSPGSLVLDAVPWGEIVALDNPAVEEAIPITPSRFTPVILSLPAGEYWITMRFPPTGQVEERVVRVDSDGRVEERVIFESIDAKKYFERIGW